MIFRKTRTGPRLLRFLPINILIGFDAVAER